MSRGVDKLNPAREENRWEAKMSRHVLSLTTGLYKTAEPKTVGIITPDSYGRRTKTTLMVNTDHCTK